MPRRESSTEMLTVTHHLSSPGDACGAIPSRSPQQPHAAHAGSSCQLWQLPALHTPALQLPTLESSRPVVIHLFSVYIPVRPDETPDPRRTTHKARDRRCPRLRHHTTERPESGLTLVVQTPVSKVQLHYI